MITKSQTKEFEKTIQSILSNVKLIQEKFPEQPGTYNDKQSFLCSLKDFDKSLDDLAFVVDFN